MEYFQLATSFRTQLTKFSCGKYNGHCRPENMRAGNYHARNHRFSSCSLPAKMQRFALQAEFTADENGIIYIYSFIVSSFSLNQSTLCLGSALQHQCSRKIIAENLLKSSTAHV